MLQKKKHIFIPSSSAWWRCGGMRQLEEWIFWKREHCEMWTCRSGIVTAKVFTKWLSALYSLLACPRCGYFLFFVFQHFFHTIFTYRISMNNHVFAWNGLYGDGGDDKSEHRHNKICTQSWKVKRYWVSVHIQFIIGFPQPGPERTAQIRGKAYRKYSPDFLSLPIFRFLFPDSDPTILSAHVFIYIHFIHK